MPPHQSRDAEVLDDERVRADLREPRKRVDRAADGLFVLEDVERDVHFLLPGARKADKVPQLVEREVRRERPRREVGQPAVHGVGARVERRNRRLEVARRRKQLCAIGRHVTCP